MKQNKRKCDLNTWSFIPIISHKTVFKEKKESIIECIHILIYSDHFNAYISEQNNMLSGTTRIRTLIYVDEDDNNNADDDEQVFMCSIESILKKNDE